MRRREFEKFAVKYLIPELDGFAVKGHLIFQVPVGTVFRGFVFDSSAFSADTFNPDVFVQPLYVPHDYITMTLGKRLLGNWEFCPDDPALAQRLLEAMKREGFPLLEELGSPQKIASSAALQFSSKNHYVPQARAYSLVLIGEDSHALKELNELLSMLQQMGTGIQSWALATHAEVARFRDVLIQDPSDARALLAQWTEYTRQKLKLPA